MSVQYLIWNKISSLNFVKSLQESSNTNYTKNNDSPVIHHSHVKANLRIVVNVTITYSLHNCNETILC